MITVPVNLGPRSYPIYIGSGILGGLGGLLKEYGYGKKALLVSNPAVYQRYGELVKNSLVRNGFEVITGEIGDGEEYKTLDEAAGLYDLALTGELDRRCPVIALGGGVVGDLAGFIAATYMRGVPFIQVPTTLLAQVDSSVGGKVAVNHPRGKNIIGAFYQPGLVLADVDTLQTLPARQIRSGLSEVIKYGVIWDESFLAWLEDNMAKLLSGDSEAMAQAVWESCRIKARVVEEDETELGLRAILNFGHTIGHAVEALTGYKTFTHGEAVAIGMASAAHLAQLVGMLAPADCRQIVSLILAAGLPVEIPAGLAVERIMENLRHDKKVRAGRLTFVLPEKIGRVCVRRDIPEKVIKEVITAHAKGPTM
ncbi:MAG: 3-dehydroquinate synthase [Desulfotomaculaceae bacterium]